MQLSARVAEVVIVLRLEVFFSNVAFAFSNLDPANLRKIRPRTGVEHWEELRFELARS